MSTITQLSLAEYDCMIKAGVFDRRERRRLEFIRGEIRKMNPIGSMHEVIVDQLTEWSIESLPKGEVWVRVQNSIGLPSLESAPEPDAIAAGRAAPATTKYGRWPSRSLPFGRRCCGKADAAAIST